MYKDLKFDKLHEHVSKFAQKPNLTDFILNTNGNFDIQDNSPELK